MLPTPIAAASAVAPVSVLIPAYNRADLLAETLESILAQTLPPAEVIVVDDGSPTSAVQQAVEQFAPRVRFHRTANGGICRARNIAASLAKQPYLAFCDHDDLWRARKLALQMELHRANPGLRYSFTNFRLVEDGVWSARTKLDDAPADFFPAGTIGTTPEPSGTPPQAQAEEGRAMPPENRPGVAPGNESLVVTGNLFRSLLCFQPVWPSTVLIERALFDELGGFAEQFGRNPSEDLEFLLRVVRRGPVGVVREPVVGVRRHALNYSADNDRNTLGQIEILRYMLDRHELTAEDRALVIEEILRRRVEASYGAFHRGDFPATRELLGGVPSGYMDPKTRLKALVARLPGPLARAAHRVLVR